MHLGSNPSSAAPRRMLVGEESQWSATGKHHLQPRPTLFLQFPLGSLDRGTSCMVACALITTLFGSFTQPFLTLVELLLVMHASSINRFVRSPVIFTRVCEYRCCMNSQVSLVPRPSLPPIFDQQIRIACCMQISVCILKAIKDWWRW